MGKRKGKRAGDRGSGGAGGGGRRPVRSNRPEIPKQNSMFEEYYDSLGIYAPSEREEFWEAARRELPSSFRFTGSKSHALQVQQRLRDYYIPKITEITYEGRLVDPPVEVPWFPNKLAWQMTTPKNVVRRFPPFASFQRFLVSETAVGNISRQEVVSMIPPFLLDVRPGMTVLDLCAAPGSKSAQLIEMVHGGEEARVRKVLKDIRHEEGREVSPEGDVTQQEIEDEMRNGDWADDGRSTGLLIANDVDWKRANMLIHQMKRLNSPNLIVTNHDATLYPSIRLKPEQSEDGTIQKQRYLKFDRILADVPCSGDGTMRKNVSIWSDWTPMNGLGLHQTQIRILVRSLQMLKVGGRVVYSTCSMNPIENEAVVAAAIDRCGGIDNVELIDCSDILPGLQRENGLKSWKVIGKDGRYWHSWEEIQKEKEEQGENNLGRISETVFPPLSMPSIPLERCLRILPHYQDTGAFFIAVLEKKTEIKARPEGSKKTTQSPSNVPVSNIIDELNSKSSNSIPGEHIKAVDHLVPTAAGDGQIDNATPAERQNEDPDIVPQSPGQMKRKLGEDDEGERPNKKVATQANNGLTATNGVEERQVHHPPPSGANLSLTAHERNQEPAAGGKGANKNSQIFEEPFKYLDPDHEALQAIYSFYGLDKRFPRNRFLVRNASGVPSKKIYYTSSLAKEILVENENKGIKFVHAGVNIFVKQDVQSPEICKWRIQTDGLPLLEACVSENRVIRLYSKATFKKILIEMFPKVTGNGWVNLGEIGQQALQIAMGCCVLRVEKAQGEDGFSERMVFPIWRSLHSLNLMLPKEERKALLLRIYNDDSPIIDHTKDRLEKRRESTSPFEDEDLTAESTNISAYKQAAYDNIPRDSSGHGEGEAAPNTDIKMDELAQV